MTDYPVIFSAPMVRAIIEGRKTQTRRLIRKQIDLPLLDRPTRFQHVGREKVSGRMVWEAWCGARPCNCFPAGKGCITCHLHTWAPRDRLWVRERWRPTYNAEGWREDLGRVARPSDFDPVLTAIEYLADETQELGGRSRPAIHMPRWASRLTLTVADVRVQRLQEISEEDAVAEGIVVDDFDLLCAAEIYANLWNDLNRKRAPWESNPWVTATTFRSAVKNIDELEKAA